MRKYLIGKHDVWLRAKPQRLPDCWVQFPDEGHSVYDIDIILVYEDNALIKSLPGAPFRESWMASVKDFDRDVWPQFLDQLLKYIEEHT